MAKTDRVILVTNDQQFGQVADPNKLENMITHAYDKIDENDTEFINHKKQVDPSSADVVRDKHVSNNDLKGLQDQITINLNDLTTHKKQVDPTSSDTTRDKHVANNDLKTLQDQITNNNTASVNRDNTHKNASVLDHPDQSVTTEKLKDLAVTRSKLALGAVGREQLDSSLFEQTANAAKFQEIDAQLAETMQKAPWIAVNNEPRLAPEVNDTGRVQRSIDSLSRGIIWFDGDYTIGNITLKNDIILIATFGTKLTFIDASTGINIDNLKNITISNFEMDGVNQLTSECTMVTGTNAENIYINGCRLKNGFNGIVLRNVINAIIDRCIVTNFREWGISVFGCDGLKLTNNICNNNTYDGLKLAGLQVGQTPNITKNVEIASNFCMLNTRDGMDIAVNNMENVSVHDNHFYLNTLNGIDFKCVYQGDYVKNCNIFDNHCINNSDKQINLQVEVDNALVERVYIHDNICECPNTTTSTGIRVYGGDKNIHVYENHIYKGQYGIRLIDSNGVNVYRNIIKDASRGINVELQVAPSMNDNRVFENEVDTLLECILVNNSLISNTRIHGNKNKTAGSVYRISDLGTNTLMWDNFVDAVSVAPTGRATKGEIWRNTSLVAGGYMGWVATSTSSASTIKGYGAIQA